MVEDFIIYDILPIVSKEFLEFDSNWVESTPSEGSYDMIHFSTMYTRDYKSDACVLISVLVATFL